MKTNRVQIIVEGGVVQNVISNLPLEYQVVDHDNVSGIEFFWSLRNAAAGGKLHSPWCEAEVDKNL